MKHRCYKGAAILERLLEVVNGIVNLLILEISIGLRLTCYFLSFSLVCQTLRVIELRVAVFTLYSALEVSMSFFKVLLIKVHVAAVEVVVRIFVIQFNCLLVFIESSCILT